MGSGSENSDVRVTKYTNQNRKYGKSMQKLKDTEVKSITDKLMSKAGAKSANGLSRNISKLTGGNKDLAKDYRDALKSGGERGLINAAREEYKVKGKNSSQLARIVNSGLTGVGNSRLKASASKGTKTVKKGTNKKTTTKKSGTSVKTSAKKSGTSNKMLRKTKSGETKINKSQQSQKWGFSGGVAKSKKKK